MVTNRIIFFATSVQPNPEEIDYWVDLSDNPYGGSIKYFNGTEWVRLAASGGIPDLSNYYTKTQVNKLLNDKANISDVDSKVDDEEVKDVIKDIQFNTSNPNDITMVMFKYDGSNKTVSIPVASTSSAGIITSKDFLDFVKQHQLQELHTEMIDTFADIRAKYQKKLIAGLNIEIDQETNVISASGDLAVQWDNITNKPDFKPVATSGDYNDLINKLKPGKDVSISEDNTISIAIDSDSLEQSLATLQSNIDKEAATARAAETKLGNDIATEKNRAQSAEQTISTNLQNEINRSTQVDTQHTNAINKEVQDRKEAIATEVSDRNAAILVETNRAKAKEEELDNKITNHTAATNAALALKADKSDTYTKEQVDAKLSGAYKVKGSSTFEALPKDNNVVGDVYNITNAFNLGGKHYDAGTNVVWTEDGWDALSGSFDTTAIEGSIQEVADDLASEVTRAKGAESANATAIANEVERATGVEEALRTDVEDLTGQVLVLEKTKVNKVEGKGLSTNDYTTPEKNKLAAIEAEANKYVLPAATTTTLGGIIVGDRLSIDDTGKLVATYTYTLPTASNTVLGGVKIGSNITNTNGTISITKANVTSALGVDPTTKYVTLDTAQTITGQKTFSKDVIFNNTLTGIHNAGGNLIFGAGTEKIVCLLADYFGPVEAKTSTINLGNKDRYWKGVHAGRLISYTTDGTAPIQVSSTTLCTNLNADMVDGYHSEHFSQNKSNKSLQTSSDKDTYFKIIELTRNTATTDSIYIKYGITVRAVSAIDYSNTTLYGDIEIFGSFSPYKVVNYKVRCSSDFINKGRLRAYVNGDNLQIWYVGYIWENVATYKRIERNINHFTVNYNIELTSTLPNIDTIPIEGTQPEDWYGVSWSETSSNPDCIRIGNMDMHRSLPIQSMMKPFAFQTQPLYKDQFVPMKENFSEAMYGYVNNGEAGQVASTVNVMIKIPEFWYVDDYTPGTKTHNLKICPHAKPGWYHHKEAYVSAYEAFNFDNKGRLVSMRSVVPTVNFNRTNGRTWARANGFDGEAKWNLYTYEEHRAICHLFLVEYATRNSQKAVNTELTPEGFRQGGLGSGCTTGTATINGAQTWSFIPTGSSDSLGSGSGEVTVTIQQTDQSGSNTSTITRKCNRYRGIENPFGHIWKHTDDIISKYEAPYRTWYKSVKPDQFATNKNNSYKPLCSVDNVNTGYKTEIKATPACDFFSMSVSGGSETTYWCDYNWDNTDTSEHCLLIGGNSGDGGKAGLFYLVSALGVSYSSAALGSRLTYLPWAE